MILKYAVDKLGNKSADSILDIPFDYGDDSLWALILNYRSSSEDTCRSSDDSWLRFIASNLRSFKALKFLLLKPNQLTLDQLCAYRADVYQLSVDGKMPLLYAKILFTYLNKVDLQLACGRFITDIPRYRNHDTQESRSRQIQQVDTLWDILKRLDNVNHAKEISLTEISSINNAYLNAALKDLTDFDTLYEATSKYIYIAYSSTHYSTYKWFKGLRKNLGISSEVSGPLIHHFHPILRGTLPPRVLLSALIILKLELPLNTDVYLNLTIDNITFKRTSVMIHNAIKYKTLWEVPTHTFTNRDRATWLAWKLLQQHFEMTRNAIEHYKISQTREQRLFDYITVRGKDKKAVYSVIKDFQYLTGKCYQRFIKDHGLTKVSLDGLRNLVSTKKYLDGSTVEEIKELLAHRDSSTTENYIDQLITSAFLRHNILIFMREFETASIMSEAGAKLFGDKLPEDKKDYFEIGDGSLCSNPYDSPDPHQKPGQLCNGKYCHSQCSNNRISLSPHSMYKALVKREYYRSNYFFMISNQETFEAFEAQKVIFNLLLCMYIQQERPEAYRELMEKINSVRGGKPQ